MKYVINGAFLTEPVMGVQRYAYEVIRRMDALLCKESCAAKSVSLEVLIPDEDKPQDYGLRAIRPVHRGRSGGKLWEQLTYAKYLWESRAEGIALCNAVPLFARTYAVCVHDIAFRTHGEYFREKGAWHEKLYRRAMYRKAFHSAQQIITVSAFSRKEISGNYRLKNPDILIAGNGWQHMKQVDIDENIFQKYQDIRKENYYFYMASLAPNKNLRWIVDNARFNPQAQYILAGRPLGAESGADGADNIRYVGYVTDGEAAALMKYCRAFLFPSIYEGFGIPPLEALSLGARIVVSDIPVFREIYGDAAYYINPYSPKVMIEKMLADRNIAPFAVQEVLQRYSWDQTAEQILGCLAYA